ncbi:MAG: hypothetical protein ACI92E_002351 [Oceanicoccus sp.]
MVVKSRPGRFYGLVIGLFIIAAVIAIMSFWWGGFVMRNDYIQLNEEHQSVLEKLNVLETKYQNASQGLANSSVGAEVDRQSVEDVRGTVSEHKQTIAELSEEIAFYKGLMSPSELEGGLGIRSWEVVETNVAQQFQFKLVVQQRARKHVLLSGRVTIVLEGKQDGKALSFSLHDLSEQIKDKSVNLRFKYFQYVEGELTLPAGFVPEHVDIVVKSEKPKAVNIEKQYAWLTTG